jgi:hypothetical protein
MAGTGHVSDKLMITDPADWQLIRPGDVVVDPLVLRYGEIFLGGRGGAGERAEAKWRAIANDVGGLLLFFDQVVLRERIPIFNYGDTFDMGLNLSERVLARVNEYEEILVEVDVQYLPYAQAKSVAIEQVKELFNEKRALPDDLAREIIRHLSVFEYDWNPNVDALGLETEKERRLAAFLVGGLVFGAYAQQTGAPHVLQPKRSRLFTAVSLKSENASDAFESKLFRDLARVIHEMGGTVENMPILSFMPLLLSRGNARETPADVLARALAFRSLPAVRDYRAQLAALFAEWADEGSISQETRRSVKGLTDRVARELGIAKDELVSAKLNAAQLGTGGLSAIDASVDLRQGTKRLWGWVFPGLINRGSRKLLTRATAAQSEYVDIAKALRNRWAQT